MRHTPHTRRVLLPVDDQAREQGRRRGLDNGALRRAPVPAHVPQALPHMPGDAAPLQALHRCLVAEHRRPQPHKLQHALRTQDPHDHLPGYRTPGAHGVAMDHRLLDPQTVRKVNIEYFMFSTTGGALKLTSELEIRLVCIGCRIREKTQITAIFSSINMLK